MYYFARSVDAHETNYPVGLILRKNFDLLAAQRSRGKSIKNCNQLASVFHRTPQDSILSCFHATQPMQRVSSIILVFSSCFQFLQLYDIEHAKLDQVVVFLGGTRAVHNLFSFPVENKYPFK